MFDIAGQKPHATLAVYHEIESLATFEEKFKAFFAERKKIHCHVEAIGSFPASGTCFVSPTVTKDLLELHKKFYTEFSDYKAAASPYYCPGRWIPHCTLATQLAPDKLAEALSYCLGTFQPIEGVFESVDFVEIIVDGDRCVSGSTMISTKFI
jgi:2'-5' RNA ligase